MGKRRNHHRSVGAYPFKAPGEFIKLFALVPEIQIGGISRCKEGTHQKNDGGYIDPCHQRYDGAYGSIYVRVVPEVA